MPAADLPGSVSDALDARITARLRAPDYRAWRAQVEATGGCAAPIHLTGSSRVLDRDGAVLLERSGTVLAPCGNRRATVCPACSDRYAADAYHLLRAGLAGDDTKGVPDTRHRAPAGVPDPDRALVRAGPHPQAHPPRARHPLPLRRAAPPRRPPPRHRRRPRHATTTPARCSGRPTPARCGPGSPSPCAAPSPPRSASGRREFRDHARLSYAKVAEYQRRGLVHFHAVIRLDGPDGPTDPPPAGLDPRRAARRHHRPPPAPRTLTTARPDGTPLVLGWGAQLDLRPVTPTARGTARGRRPGRSPTPPWPATSPSTPPKAPAPSTAAKAPTGRSATARTSSYLRRSAPHHRRMIDHRLATRRPAAATTR